MQGWNVTSELNKTVDSISQTHLLSLSAEPVFAEIGEKVRELTGDLHEKILNQELQWSLMMTPLSLINNLKDMCENEINRREAEIREYCEGQEEEVATKN